MKVLTFFLVLLFPILCIAQNKNSLTAYYGVKNSVLFEYGYLLKYDRYNEQNIGLDFGVGYVFDEEYDLKTTIGFRGVQLRSYKKLDHIYKIGLVFYDFEYYDIFIGYGIQINRIQIIGKLNLIRTITGQLNDEWAELGIGFSF